MKSWKDKGDTEAALVAASFVEDRIGFGIKSYFVELPATGDTDKRLTEAALFDGYGPLSSFFAKIDMGCALGIYGLLVRNDLHVIRSIRNDFAHTIEPIDFLDETVSRKLKKLKATINLKHVADLMDLVKPSLHYTHKYLYLITCATIGSGIHTRTEHRIKTLRASSSSSKT